MTKAENGISLPKSESRPELNGTNFGPRILPIYPDLDLDLFFNIKINQNLG